MTENKLTKRLQGVVVSNKMNKTCVVKVANIRSHKKYHKRYSIDNRFLVHDEKGECQIGDMVEIEETRPISKNKKWRVVSKLK